MALRTSLDEGVLRLTLDRPDRYNAIDSELRDALLDAIETAADQGARAILLHGAGKGFCAGADLKETGARVTGVALEQRMAGSSSRLARTVLQCRVPLVVAVHGACAGIGMTLALGADVCLAADDARFTSPFVARGLVPDGAVAQLLPRVVGFARARELLLLGRAIDAPEAERLGMVARLVPEAELLATAGTVAAELAALPPAAVGYTKQLLNHAFELDLDAFLAEERTLQALLSTED